MQTLNLINKMPYNIDNIQTLNVDTHTVRLDYSGRFERNSIPGVLLKLLHGYIYKYGRFVSFLFGK